jgi:curli production assembly/transport component CsgE
MQYVCSTILLLHKSTIEFTAMRVVIDKYSCSVPSSGLLWAGLLWACAAATPGLAQQAPRQTTPPAESPARPQPVPKATIAPKVLVTPSAKPLPPAKLEEALRLMLRADSLSRRTGPESAGLVLDQAITKVGHDFYDLFYGAFEAPPNSTDFTVLVGERPGRGNSSLFVLTVNDQELIETPLPTRQDQLEELAAQAVEIAQGYLVELQNVSRQLESGQRTPLEVY